MSHFDPKGTAPGLASQEAPEKVVHLKCPQHGCKSVSAVERSAQDPQDPRGATHTRTYCCTACGTTWTMAVGGSVNF